MHSTAFLCSKHPLHSSSCSHLTIFQTIRIVTSHPLKLVSPSSWICEEQTHHNLQIWQSCAIFTLAEYIKRAPHLKSAMYNQCTWMCTSVQRSFAISKVRRDARRSNAMQAGRRCWRQKSAMRRIAASALWPVKVTITSISFECRWSCVLSADMCVFRSICVKPSWSRFSANNQHWALMSNVRLVGKKGK